jgi:hypothetical protein
MSVRCAIGGHKAAPRQIYNSGFYFGACVRCGRDLVRAPRGEWRAPPAGHRVTWKPGRHMHSIEADYADVLPVAVHKVALPARPSPFLSWCRDLARSPRRKAAAAVAVAAAEEIVELRYPRLVVMAVMVGAGLRLLLGPGAGR